MASMGKWELPVNLYRIQKDEGKWKCTQAASGEHLPQQQCWTAPHPPLP